MNREILFRGKRTDNGEWVKGLPFSFHANNKPVGIETYDGNRHVVDYTTIGQYTGLTDKDGRKIFEGDILRQGTYGFPFFVVYDDGGFIWNENGRSGFLYQCICDICEVIGNIHDNPELLEGE